MNPERIVVVGGNISGLRALETLRAEGFEGELFLISEDEHLPYNRPFLSKELLTNEVSATSVYYHEESWYRDQRIELLMGMSASGLDLRKRCVVHRAGTLEFDAAIIATGSRARDLAHTERLAGVFTLRNLDDALQLREWLVPGNRLVVVGAGFIGAEVASSARSLGLEVTVLESAEAPMIRAIGKETGAALGGIHGNNGTVLRCGVGVVGLKGRGRIEHVMLSDGTQLPADVVVVGIGVVPNVEWLAGSGLQIDNGIVCDRYLCAGVDRVFAAGDAALVDHGWLGHRQRGEQWTTAADQGRLAAFNLLKGPQLQRPFETMPYFWSDQYGIRIQSAGWTSSGEATPLVGSAGTEPFVGLYLRNGLAVGAIAANAPRQFAKIRKILPRLPSIDEAKSAIAN